MNIKEVEKLFKETDTLDLALDEVKSDMKLVDKWSKDRKAGICDDNPVALRQALNQLSGAYANLRILNGIADTELTNSEVRKYNELKMNLENEGTKFTTQVDSAIKREASESVGVYRRVKNIIQAYQDSADKHIITLQSILKYLEKEQYKNPSTEA